MIIRKCFPRLIVFDLDHTLWPFGVDQFYFKPPYKRIDKRVVDSENKQMKCYDEVTDVLLRLSSEQTSIGTCLAVASRTEYPEGAVSLLELFGLSRHFKYKEIYPSPKTLHFQQFHNKSLINYKDMLFFDNEQRNIDDVQRLGVTSVLINEEYGVTHEAVNEGLRKFIEVHSKS